MSTQHAQGAPLVSVTPWRCGRDCRKLFHRTVARRLPIRLPRMRAACSCQMYCVLMAPRLT